MVCFNPTSSCGWTWSILLPLKLSCKSEHLGKKADSSWQLPSLLCLILFTEAGSRQPDVFKNTPSSTVNGRYLQSILARSTKCGPVHCRDHFWNAESAWTLFPHCPVCQLHSTMVSLMVASAKLCNGHDDCATRVWIPCSSALSWMIPQDKKENVRNTQITILVTSS